MLQKYCLKNNKKIIANLRIPLCHLFFYTQRNENKDMVQQFRDCYTKFLNLPFPISICSDRTIELENRIRFMEKLFQKGVGRTKSSKKISLDKKDINIWNYIKYKVSSKLTFGETRMRHQNKYKQLKEYYRSFK